MGMKKLEKYCQKPLAVLIANILTITKRDEPKGWTPKDARVDTGQLGIDNSLQLRVPGSPLAVRCRGDDAVNAEGVARVLSVRDGIRNKSSRVSYASRLGKVNHDIGVVLLVARVSIGQEGIDSIDTCKLHAWLVCENIPSARELQTSNLSITSQGRI